MERLIILELSDAVFKYIANMFPVKFYCSNANTWQILMTPQEFNNAVVYHEHKLGHLSCFAVEAIEAQQQGIKVTFRAEVAEQK